MLKNRVEYDETMRAKQETEQRKRLEARLTRQPSNSRINLSRLNRVTLKPKKLNHHE
jgi:hypothetical protein